MKLLPQGGNTTIATCSARVRLGWSPLRIGNLDVDASAFLLRADGRVRADDDMIFYNQPSSPDGSVKLVDGCFILDLPRIPVDVDRIAFAITIHEADGTGTTFSNAQTTFLEIEGIARYEAATAVMSETALIVGDVYRRQGEWKVRAVGQGFAGGLGPLARHFGIEVEEAAAPPPSAAPRTVASPVSIAAARKVDLEKRLISLEKKDPQLVSLVKKVSVSLEKKQLVTDRAKVALVLDISGSMDTLYRSGKVQHFVERAMALGYRFDDDGQIDVFLFGTQAHDYGALDVDNYRGFVGAVRQRYPLEGGTYYGKVMKLVRDFYRGQPDFGLIPVYVMFVTDGGTQDVRLSEQMILEASREPIFWSFMAIGERRSGGLFSGRSASRLPRGFDFLAYLDDMPGRLVDNANFFAVRDPAEPTDEELFELLMEEFPDWQRAAHKAGLFSAWSNKTAATAKDFPVAASNCGAGSARENMMSFWNKLKTGAASLQKGLVDEVTKFKNDGFLQAVTAGCAMMASADGTISPEEKQKMVGFIQSSDALKVFDLGKVIASFNDMIAKFEFDRIIGEGEALARISKLKGKPEARIVVGVVLAVANSDGVFDEDEKAVARKICAAAGVDRSEFDI